MRGGARRPHEGWVPLIAGLAWLISGAWTGVLALCVSLLPGVYLLGSGYAMLRWPRERRPAESAAIGSLLGVGFGLPGVVVLGLGPALLLVLLCCAAFVAAGSAGLRRDELVPGVPMAPHTLGLMARTATDEAMLGFMQHTTAVPDREEVRDLGREVGDALELFEARGWLGAPSRYLQRPAPLEHFDLAPLGWRGATYEQIRFQSEYEPEPGEPGRERWLGYEENRTARAWVMRHRDGPRPWLVCLHGYRMGLAGLDLRMFDPAELHDALGLNVLCPVLPLHGARHISGGRSGDRFLDGRVLDTLHAVAQAIWDIRRLMGWARRQDAPAIGVYGVSLGGYHAALLASLEAELACVIAGIPLVDIARVYWRHGPPADLDFFEVAGAGRDRVARLAMSVSPLAEKAQIPLEHRAVFGAVADRVVTPDQARDLWEHWERPRIRWLEASHLTFNSQPELRPFLHEVLRAGGLLGSGAG